MAPKMEVSVQVDNDVWLTFKNRAMSANGDASDALEGLMKMANEDRSLLKEAIES